MFPAPRRRGSSRLLLFVLLSSYIVLSSASMGDRLPDFKACVKVCFQSEPIPFPLIDCRQACEVENCENGGASLRKFRLCFSIAL